MSAINSARDSGHTKVVRLLLEHEAGVQGKDTSTQHPPCAAYPLSDATVFPHPLTRSFNTHTMAEILYGEDRTPNGVNRAKKIPRKDTRFRKSSGNIAAIDFGTKNCSLACTCVHLIVLCKSMYIPKISAELRPELCRYQDEPAEGPGTYAGVDTSVVIINGRCLIREWIFGRSLPQLCVSAFSS